MKYKLKEGMRMHPFSDDSGVAFFDLNTTVVSSIAVSFDVLQIWLSESETLNAEQAGALEQLYKKGFLELVEGTSLD